MVYVDTLYAVRVITDGITDAASRREHWICY